MADSIVTKSVQITFDEVEVVPGTDSVIDSSIRMEINQNDNRGKSSGFYSNESVKIRVFSDSSDPITYVSTYGHVFTEASSLPYIVTDYLVFNNETEKSLSYPLRGSSANYSWQGSGGGYVKIQNSKAIVSSPITGVLKIEYRTYYDRLILSVGNISEETKVFVRATQGNSVQGVNVDFLSLPSNYIPSSSYNDPSAEINNNLTNSVTLKPYTIYVRDFSTGAFVVGAEVYVNDIYKGFTDSNGRLFLGNLTPGTYSLKIRKAGYLDSETDDLNNDYFTVVG